MIKKNIEIVQEKIKNSCNKSGRDVYTAQLIAVSKTKPVEMLRQAYDAGMRDFGEKTHIFTY